jgi:hypothetical protein
MNPYIKQRQKEAKELSLALGRMKLLKHIENMKKLSSSLQKFASTPIPQKRCTTPEEQPGKCERLKGCWDCESYR